MYGIGRLSLALIHWQDAKSRAESLPAEGSYPPQIKQRGCMGFLLRLMNFG